MHRGAGAALGDEAVDEGIIDRGTEIEDEESSTVGIGSSGRSVS
ncbi:hypothetical protein PUR57_00950 [Streptomyces sp. JV176]|nr:hypothetical protein [Streptomyces sp. JV176]MEE1797271.1 hypothetical protein [Streptomyces sp. JV176]